MVSCASPGNCAVSGKYNASFGGTRPFVASQVKGRWHPAINVPGSPALYAGTNESEILSISCGSAGNCAAGGYNYDGSGRRQGFVVSQVGGEWAGARNVPGLGKLNGGGDAKVNAVSCASAGNCAAGGYYASGAGLGEAFLASEVNGRWGTAHEVSGTGALNKGGDASIDTVSCASAGNCSASGYYETSSGHYQEFAVSELNGTWGTAKEVPGTGALNKGGNDEVNSMSCGSAGNCDAGGYYTDASGHTQAFLVSQVNGIWRTAIEVPGTSALNLGMDAQVDSVSCGSAGNCVAVGYYTDGSTLEEAFRVSQVNGTWRKAVEVAGSLNLFGNAELRSVSCVSAGKCSAGGTYTDGFGNPRGFVASQS
jgi:hypothetical protein